MSANTVIVMPGRFGDVINVLPCARDIARNDGGKCAVMVSAEFASVLEGCSYVEPVIVSSHFTDVQPAIDQAQRMFSRVLVGKTNERNVGVTNQCESFNEESWRQIGYLDRWNDLPLVFDRRDREREVALVRPRVEGRSRILVNFTGKSAAYPHGDTILNLLSKTKIEVVDIGKVKAHRLFDLIGVFDDADLLITADTATLHLAAASGIAVVNLIGDQPTRWHGSKPRNNSALEIRYSDVEPLQRILSTLVKWKPRTWHAWSIYPIREEAERRRGVAAYTWRQQKDWIDFPVPVGARVINDPMRAVPFIKDIVEAAIATAGPRDTIVLTNADTCVPSDASERIRQSLSMGACLYSFRRDFPPFGNTKSAEEIRTGTKYAGADLFAFTVRWWQEHQHKFPDMVLGAEAWDLCLRKLMAATGGVEFDNLCYHEKHPNIWEHPDHRHSLPSQKHNLALAAQFLK